MKLTVVALASLLTSMVAQASSFMLVSPVRSEPAPVLSIALSTGSFGFNANIRNSYALDTLMATTNDDSPSPSLAIWKAVGLPDGFTVENGILSGQSNIGGVYDATLSVQYKKKSASGLLRLTIDPTLSWSTVGTIPVITGRPVPPIDVTQALSIGPRTDTREASILVYDLPGLSLDNGQLSGTFTGAVGPHTMLATVILGRTSVTSVIGSLVASKNVLANNAGVRSWSDGSLAKTCNDYLNATEPSSVYSGDVGSGSYALDIDGSGPLDPVTVHCDMTFNGGGWTSFIYSNRNATATESLTVTNDLAYLPVAHMKALANQASSVLIYEHDTNWIRNDTPGVLALARSGRTLNISIATSSWTRGAGIPESVLSGNNAAIQSSVYPQIYWASDNTYGLHFGAGQTCWQYTTCIAGGRNNLRGLMR